MKILIILLFLVSSIFSHQNNQTRVVTLTQQTFYNTTNIVLKPDANTLNKMKQNWFIMFYAPWCIHCKKNFPVWQSLALELENNENIKIGVLNCQQNSIICEQIDLTGYPTLIYFKNDLKAYKFSGTRNITEFLNYVNQSFQTVTHINFHKPSIAERLRIAIAQMDIFNFLIAITIGAGFLYLVFTCIFKQKQQKLLNVDKSDKKIL